MEGEGDSVLRLVIISRFYPPELRKGGLYCSVKPPVAG